MLIAVELPTMFHADWAVDRERAVTSTLTRIGDLRDKYKPEHFYVADDCRRDTCWRRRRWPTYKANRAEPEQAYLDARAACLDALSRDGVTIVGVDGSEADDVVASLVTQIDADKSVIVSTDKDCRQLLCAGKVVLLRKFNRQDGRRVPEWYGVEDLAKPVDQGGWWIRPEQCADFQCLAGDTSDGIRGASGIGEKTAAELLHKYLTLESIVENAAELTEVKRAAVLELWGRIDDVRPLVELRRDVPVTSRGVHRWRLRLERYDGDDVLICRCPACEWRGGRFYGRVRADKESDLAAMMQAIHQQIARQGFYEPGLVQALS